jgi:hypothetical protein
MSARWAMFVIGMWLAGTIIVSVVATQNFRTVDRLMMQSAHPQFLSIVERVEKPAARDFLRYLSSELNRLYFRLWNLSQLLLGLVLLWLTWQAPFRVRIAVSLMLAIVVVMLAWLVPQITAVGRGLDFVPRDPPPPALRRFWMLHGAYTGLEMLKLAIGAVAAVWIGRSQS